MPSLPPPGNAPEHIAAYFFDTNTWSFHKRSWFKVISLRLSDSDFADVTRRFLQQAELYYEYSISITKPLGNKSSKD